MEFTFEGHIWKPKYKRFVWSGTHWFYDDLRTYIIKVR